MYKHINIYIYVHTYITLFPKHVFFLNFDFP